MDKDIIDPVIRRQIIQRNAENLRFEDIQTGIIQKLSKLWNTDQEVEHAKIENQYYTIEYSIKNNYNHDGNRFIIMNGKRFQGYRHEDISNIVKRFICE